MSGVDTSPEQSVLDQQMAWVRASGRVYARHARQAATTLAILRGKLAAAYEAGAGVSELAEASGLSRQAVYRAVKGLVR